MKKLINWFKASNHWKHTIVCFVLTLFLGAAAGISAGVAAEWKDKQHGGIFDWSDILADVVGVALGMVVRHFVGCGTC